MALDGLDGLLETGGNEDWDKSEFVIDCIRAKGEAVAERSSALPTLLWLEVKSDGVAWLKVRLAPVEDDKDGEEQ